MKKLTRRVFLASTATLGAAALAGCGKTAETTAPAVQNAADGVKIAISRWKGASDNEEALRQAAIRLTETAIENLGGMARFVPKGSTVWIKPNINFHRTPEFAANSNPHVVATVARLCIEAGAGKVRVGDVPYFGADQSYAMSGIADAVKAVGAEMVFIDKEKPEKFREAAIGGKFLDKWPLSTEIIDADILINLPVAKQHPLPKFSGCMKNLMGVAGGDRSKWHDNIAGYVSDLNSFVKPRLHVVDVIRSIISGPPKGGNLDDVKYFGVVAAGTDPVALDAFAATTIGFKPSEIETLTTGASRGLGTLDYASLNPREATVSA
jgi:uncharacterized protein (DUF362 family)